MGLAQNKLVNLFFKVDQKRGSSKVGITVGFFSAFAGILYGYDTGTISGIMAMDYVLERFPKDKTAMAFSSSEHSLIVSILSLGTFFGALLGSFFADRIGRRMTIILSTLIVFNIGIILQTAATSIPLLCAGRAIGGLGVGLISSCIPLYQAECTPKWIRGALIASYQWAITLGLLLASCVNQGTHNRKDSGSYRIPIALQFAWALILGCGLIFLPESPRFFVKRGDTDKALESLAVLHSLPVDDPIILEEYNEIKANYEYELAQGSATWVDVFRTRNSQLKKLITACFLQGLQQLTGINFIFYYGTTFFQSSGISNSFLISLATNIVNFGMSVPGVLLVELVGRRNLLLGGSIGMCVSDFIIAIVGVASNSGSANKVLVAFTCFFIAFFAASWGPICWVVTGEIFPLAVRAKSIALATASNWLWNFGIAYATPYLVDSGPGNADLGSNVFFIWGGCNLLGLFFVWALVYETKGLTLEEIEEMYNVVPLAWRSQGFIPTGKELYATQEQINISEKISESQKEDVTENDSDKA
ncbi:hypothetical protein DASC09_061700 [Saccharomycopsis crataegensis]|uniref:Major facilitator superfamily (MFS) profile domain-containing protein n=1 Tax=Saccharomycopsis crataegensis TaxID=43959 RepID=A0AAV5QVU0_9ASCO|nr:hypothetical protein DASC09_061700 [Saccharomycopsis crataegensis]